MNLFLLSRFLSLRTVLSPFPLLSVRDIVSFARNCPGSTITKPQLTGK